MKRRPPKSYRTFLRVHALIDLLQGGVTRTLELVEGLRVFRFKDRDADV